MTANWRKAVEYYVGTKLPEFPVVAERPSQELFARADVSARARAALLRALTDVIIFGLKDLHTIYRLAHETVGADASSAGVEDFFADLGSHRRMLARPAAMIESVIEDWSGRFYRYALGFVADAQRELGIIGQSRETSPGDLPQIRSIEFFRSDPHDDAFGAIEVELFSGLVWYYKPRPDTADRAVAQLLEGLASPLGSRVPVCAPETRAFGDHHWSLDVEAIQIGSVAQLAQSAENLGVFAAIAYFFNFNDLHFENVLLSSPIALVDAETSFVNTARDDGPLRDPTLGHADRIAYELVRTGLVPTWQRAGFDSEWDITPLGSHGVFKLDGFKPDYRGGGWAPSSFRNTVTDLALSTEDYGSIVRPAFVKGFREAYSSVLKSKREVTKLLDEIAQPWSRCILRQTHFYAKVLEKSFHPQVLFGLQDRTDFIRQCLNTADDRRDFLPKSVLEYEIASLDALSIPTFRADCRTTDLAFGGALCEGFFDEPAMNEIERRLDQNTMEDLQILEGCIDMQFKKRFSPHELARLSPKGTGHVL